MYRHTQSKLLHKPHIFQVIMASGYIGILESSVCHIVYSCLSELAAYLFFWHLSIDLSTLFILIYFSQKWLTDLTTLQAIWIIKIEDPASTWHHHLFKKWSVSVCQNSIRLINIILRKSHISFLTDMLGNDFLERDNHTLNVVHINTKNKTKIQKNLQ